MHRSSRAPVLSATRTLVSCWIMRSPGHLEDLGEPPALQLRQRPRLDDADEVAGLRLVLLVVCVELRRAADHLLVLRVRLDRVPADDDRFVHRRRDDDAAALLVAAAVALGLRQARDRLALSGLLTLRLGVLVALG